MTVYKKEHHEVKECVRALDESLNGKASKVEFFDLRNRLELYMTKEEVADNDKIQQDNIDRFTEEIKVNKDSLEMIKESMSTAIYEAVKKANV